MIVCVMAYSGSVCGQRPLHSLRRMSSRRLLYMSSCVIINVLLYYSYAPWCPACQHLQTDWENLGRESESLGISVGRVDVTQQPGLIIPADAYNVVFICFNIAEG